MTTPLPFSGRATAATSLFPCIFIASPQGAQSLSPTVTQLGELSLVYAQMLSIYRRLLNQDTANVHTDLVSALTDASAAVQTLNTIVDAMTATADAHFILVHFQIVAANALGNINAALRSES